MQGDKREYPLCRLGVATFKRNVARKKLQPFLFLENNTSFHDLEDMIKVNRSKAWIYW